MVNMDAGSSDTVSVGSTCQYVLQPSSSILRSLYTMHTKQDVHGGSACQHSLLEWE